MSKPIQLTEDLLQEMQKEFAEALRKAKMSDGKITYTKSFVWKEDTDVATLEFTPTSYVKMVSLLQHFDSEVAWHGVVSRDTEDPLHFVIEDILVYPQKVSGATVNTDQEEYTNWLYGLEDAVFNALKMQGHSHVDMGVSPSSVDLTHQSEILSQLEGDMFYIFMIWNKRLEHTIKIYDLGSNTLYEDEDIQLVCPDLEDFLTEADQMVKKKSSAPAAKSKKSSAGYSAYSGYPYYPAAKDDPYGYGDFDDDFEDSYLPRKSARYTY